MKLNTVIRLPDASIGTICYHNLDGDGGVWGRHHFEMPPGGFADSLPKPDFMLREKTMETMLKARHKATMECVGEVYQIVEAPNADPA